MSRYTLLSPVDVLEIISPADPDNLVYAGKGIFRARWSSLDGIYQQEADHIASLPDVNVTQPLQPCPEETGLKDWFELHFTIGEVENADQVFPDQSKSPPRQLGLGV